MNAKTVYAWSTFLVLLALVAWAQGSSANRWMHQDAYPTPDEPRRLEMTAVNHQATADQPLVVWGQYPAGNLWESYCQDKYKRGPQHPTQRGWYPIAKHFSHRAACGHDDCNHGHCNHRSIPRGPFCALNTMLGMNHSSYGHVPHNQIPNGGGPPVVPPAPATAAPAFSDPAAPTVTPRRNEIPHVVRPVPMPNAQPQVDPRTLDAPANVTPQGEPGGGQPGIEQTPAVPRNVIPDTQSSSRRQTFARSITYQRRLSDYIWTH